jgi:hypothetical protein
MVHGGAMGFVTGLVEITGGGWVEPVIKLVLPLPPGSRLQALRLNMKRTMEAFKSLTINLDMVVFSFLVRSFNFLYKSFGMFAITLGNFVIGFSSQFKCSTKVQHCQGLKEIV